MDHRLDNDDFWCVALEPDMPNGGGRCFSHDERNEETDTSLSRRHRSYILPLPENDTVTLRLSDLAESEGVWSHLGSQAWHASALLAAYLLNNEEEWRPSCIQRQQQGEQQLTVLELGSGAVGLSGLTLTIAVGRRCKGKSLQVLLTDLDEDGLLDNLRKNVTENEYTIKQACGGTLFDIEVQALDWNSHVAPNATPLVLPPLSLVVGSELVYTEQTAEACAAVIINLLRDNPSCSVLIVQVVDRHGFQTRFIPTLEEAGLSVSIQQPIDEHLHRMACGIVASNREDGTVLQKLGGTLDRFDYGACWIRNKKL